MENTLEDTVSLMLSRMFHSTKEDMREENIPYKVFNDFMKDRFVLDSFLKDDAKKLKDLCFDNIEYEFDKQHIILLNSKDHHEYLKNNIRNNLDKKTKKYYNWDMESIIFDISTEYIFMGEEYAKSRI